MYIAKQFSIFMVNKPGVFAQLLGEFAASKINITAIVVMDSVEHGVMRVVAQDSNNLRKTLESLNIQYSETDVLCITIPNKSGAFAAITEKLAKAHINIAYAYCTAGAPGGKTISVIKVADVKKAMHVLHGTGTDAQKQKQSKTADRRPLSAPRSHK